jgi:uncharacterized protein DUF4238
LPAVYLKQFSPDGRAATRKSFLWRLGKQRQAFVKVEDQCREAFHYSKANARRVEMLFQEGESLYGKAMQQIWRGAEATKRQYFGLIIMMMSLHLRSPAYKNLAKWDNFEVYLGLEETFMRQVLMADFADARTQEDRLERFSEIWRVTIMRTPDETFTSDNPALCCAINESSHLHLILLPVTPAFCAVAFDKRRVEIIGPMTTEDLSEIQTLLAGTSIEALFSHQRFSKEESQALNKFRSKQKRPEGSVEGTHWTPNFLTLKRPFGFLRFVQQKT